MVEEQMTEQGLYDIYGTWYVPLWQRTWFKLTIWGVVTCVALCILIFLIKKYLQHRRRKKLPVWEIALQRIEQLKQQNKVTAEHGKEFYLTVTAVLKEYLNKRYDYKVQSKTDDELIAYLEQAQFPAGLLQHVRDICDGAVFIKFANAQAAQEKIEQDFDRSITLIKQTIPAAKKP